MDAIQQHQTGATHQQLTETAEEGTDITIEVIASASGNTLARLSVKDTATLHALAISVATATEVPIYEQRLLLDTADVSQLPLDTSVNTAGIIDGSRLTLVRVPPPHPPLAAEMRDMLGMMMINDCPLHPYTRCACAFRSTDAQSTMNLADASSIFENKKKRFQPLQRLSQVFQKTFTSLWQSNITLNTRPDQLMSLDFKTQETLRDSWLMQARGESVSTLGFEHLHNELQRFGAPEELVVAAKRAALDEQQHAEICVKLATRFDPQHNSHSLPVIKRSLHPFESMEALVTHVALEGCWGETLGALTAARQHRVATDKEVKDVLMTIAAEEFQHCVLAWKTAAWAISVSGTPVADHFSKRINQVTRATDAKPLVAASIQPGHETILPDLEPFGVLSVPAMEKIDITYGPQLVHELLRLLSVNRGTDIGKIDFASVVKLHCDKEGISPMRL